MTLSIAKSVTNSKEVELSISMSVHTLTSSRDESTIVYINNIVMYGLSTGRKSPICRIISVFFRFYSETIFLYNS